MKFVTDLLHWLVKRSSKNATNPKPKATPHPSTTQNAQDPLIIETVSDEKVTLGIDTILGEQDNLAKGPGGELIRSHQSVSILSGCNHIVSQLQPTHEEGKLPSKGLAGKCIYCVKEVQKLVKKGKLDPLEADRLSLVCTDCAKMTVSGTLCCPKHYVAIDNGTNQTLYLDPDEQARESQKKLVQTILLPFRGILGDSNPPLPSSPGEENE